MKRLFTVFGNLIALLFLVVAGWFLVRLVQGWSTPNTLQEPDVTSAPAPMVVSTPTPTLTWETATLDQIHFGEPKVVFSHNDNIRIYDWLPDNRRLLLAIADPEKTEAEELVDRNRLVTLDTQTGEIVEYARYPNEYHPVWLESVQGIAYTFWDTRGGGSPEVRLGLGNGQVETIDTVDGRLDVDLHTNTLFYVAGGTTEKTLKKYDTQQNKGVQSSLNDNLPWGYLHIDPTGHWMVTFGGGIGYSPLYLADRDKGLVTEVSFASWWPIDAIWSADGEQLALVLSNQSESRLAVLNPQTLEWGFIDLPVSAIYELDVCPGSSFILLKAASQAEPYPNTFWMVDLAKRTFKEITYFPQTRDSTKTLMACSSTGLLAWRTIDKELNRKLVITQLSLQGGVQ